MAASQHRCVFVGNIPYDATEEQLVEICQEVGPVVSFRLVIDRETGKPKGYGFCEYKDEETALSARRNLQGYEINGRQLRVDFAENDKGTDRSREQGRGGPGLTANVDPQKQVGGPSVHAESLQHQPIGLHIAITAATVMAGALGGAQAGLQSAQSGLQNQLAPPNDPLTLHLAKMSRGQLNQIMAELRVMAIQNKELARQLLLARPQLPKALFQAQIMLGMVSSQMLRMPNIRQGRFHRRNNRGDSNSFSKGSLSSKVKAESFTRNRGGRDSGKELRVMDDTEEEEVKQFGVIGDFLSEEESDTATSDDDGFGVLREKNAASLFRGSEDEVSKKVLPKSSAGSSDSYLSESRFDQCSVSPLSLKGIKDAGYEKMTVVQEATLPVILKGKDVLAKARTGTGKTVAFLLPSIEVVVNSPPITRDNKRPPIFVLVICPTRELASQAATEANKLLKYHPSIGVQVVIGGTRLALEQKRIQANPCQILVATPGRLKDHIENTAGFATKLMGVKVLILDEADHLLDMGFRKDIERIISAVPKQRQTLLFSATVPEEVRQICHIALKRDHEYINTVEEGSEETHAQVAQTHLVAPLDSHFSIVYSLLKNHIADDVDYKVLVFCTTAMVTRLVADLLGKLNLNVREIHSRKPQSYRTRVSDEFRKSKGLILVTSDVSARGVDYPDVSLVIQVGVPADRQQYIHRLGRTGRKGKVGQGILLLAPWEDFFLSNIKDLPITKASVPAVDPDTTKKVERALSKVEIKNKEAAYQAWLGYYNSNKKVGRDKHRLVELANEFSGSMGLDNPPAIPKLVLGKMGLKNVPGLRSK